MSKSKRQELTCEFSQRNGNFNLNDDINGKIIVQPFSHISFYKIIFEISWSISNGTKTEQTLLKKQEYATQNKYWMAGKRYELNFSFKSQAPLSYSSKQLKIERYLKVRVIKHEKGWSLGKNHPDYQFVYTFPYLLNPSPNSYKIGKEAVNINFNDTLLPFLTIPVAVGLLSGLNGFMLMDLFSTGIFGGGLYYTFVSFGKLGRIKASVSAFDDTHFQVQMNIQRNWSSIEKIELVHYVSFFDSTKVRSETQNISLQKLLYQKYDVINSNDFNIVRSYHSINLPPTLTTKYFKINWKLELIIHLKNGKMKRIKLETPMNILTH